MAIERKYSNKMSASLKYFLADLLNYFHLSKTVIGLRMITMVVNILAVEVRMVARMRKDCTTSNHGGSNHSRIILE